MRLLVAVMLLAACRDARSPAPKARDDAGSIRKDGPALSVSVVPALPRSDDGAQAVRALDASIDAAKNPRQRIPLLLARAWIVGRLEDYQRALTESAALVAAEPKHADAWRLRIDVLLRVHDLAAARAALKQLTSLVADPSVPADYQLQIDHASGNTDAALTAYAERAKLGPNAQNLTLYAAVLAEVGRFDEAIALIPKAASALRSNTPEYFAWLLFQWGRIYEQKGEHAAARDFFRASFARLPAHLDTIDHLIQTYRATGEASAATTLATRALADNRHPVLYAHAGNLTAATSEWERYVEALPHAFADHAARFYLQAKLAKRAYELAVINHTNRPTRAAKALLLEAAIALGDKALACTHAEPFIAAGTRAEQFLAWKALSACDRRTEADQLARSLGI